MLDNFGIQRAELPLSDTLKLNALAVIGKTALAVGDGGAMALINDAGAEVAGLPIADLNAVASFRGLFYVGMGDAIVSVNPDLDFVSGTEPGCQGSIVQLCSFEDKRICGFTDADEIVISSDGQNWTIIDFNEAYNGFYSHLDIKAIALGPHIAIAGLDSDGKPAMYVSTDGGVWSPRELNWNNGGHYEMLNSIPSGLSYDWYGDRMLLLCEDGTIFIVPGCSHCNSLIKKEGSNLRDASFYMGGYVAVGDDGCIVTSF